MPSNHIKQTSLDAISKMCVLLKKINSSIDLDQWKLIVNKKGDIPEQTNDHDCGVFTCLYARYLVGHGEIISDASISGFMKLMLLELHERNLHQIPPGGMLPEQYYAVEYVENYYIGRAVKFKFLNRVGVKSFDWPRWMTLMMFTLVCFMGTVTLENAGPFAVQNSKTLKNIYRN